MLPADAEERLLEELQWLPDPQERLAWLIQRAKRHPELPESARVDATLIPGCVSRVWLDAELAAGLCHFRLGSDSPMVLGLMRLLCDVYEGSTPAEAAAFSSQIMSRSGLDRVLSPTRLHGLSRARDRIRIAAAVLCDPEPVTT